MADVRDRERASRLDRSNCILPPSSTDATSTGRNTISVDVDPVDQQNPAFALSGVSFPTALKACWILTLQCFIVADVICFKYFGPLGPGEDEDSKARTPKATNKSELVQYYTRIDPAESVWSFLQRLDRSQLNSNASIEGHGSGVVEQRSSHHNCNTGVCLREAEDGQNDTNLDVSVSILWIFTAWNEHTTNSILGRCPTNSWAFAHIYQACV